MSVTTHHQIPNKPETATLTCEIPATHGPAVHAHAELFVLKQHLECVQEIYDAHVDRESREERIAGIEAVATRRAEETTAKIRAVAPAKARVLFESLDIARSAPDQITWMPRVWWLLGSMAALAGVRTAIASARAASGATGADLLTEVQARFSDAVVQLECRWQHEFEQMLLRHPYVVPGLGNVEIIDLNGASPRFVIPVRA